MTARAIPVLLLAALISVAACTIESDTSPARPAGLPADAVWIGGSDGGVFVRVIPGNTPQAYSGAIYHPDGQVWYQGRFVMTGRTAPASPLTTADVSAWDGMKLLLKEGGTLVAESLEP